MHETIIDKMDDKAMSLFCFHHDKTPSKKSLLMDIANISNHAKHHELKDTQKAFARANYLATLVGFWTDNRFFEEALTDPYMNAYGSGDESKNSLDMEIITRDDDDAISLSDLSKQDVDQVLPKNDWFVVLAPTDHDPKGQDRPRRLTQGDVYKTVHHALYSLVHDDEDTGLRNLIKDVANNVRKNQ